MNALERAIKIVDGQSALARAIGEPIQQGHIWYWLREKDGQVPAEHCAAIERATDGKVSRHELRPDIFGPAPVRSPTEPSKAAA